VLIFRSLRQSERMLEDAQRVAHVGYWDRDLVASRVTLSDETCRIFGFEPDERVTDLAVWHARWQALIHPDDRPTVLAAVTAALAGGPRYDVEFRIVRHDGAVRVVHSQGDVMTDASGRPCRMFGTQQDVTELRQAENALRASEARFRIFADHATDAFFRHDDDSRVIDVNRQACESLGYSREELIGMHPRDFDAGLDPSSLAQVIERIGGGDTVTFETLHRRKDGHVFPVEIRARQFEEGGRRFRLALVRDISERKRAERRVLVQHAIARVLSEAETVDEAMPRILESVGECLDWDLATLWRVDREAGVLRCAELWRRPSIDLAHFEAATRASTFGPGRGLPGRVWASRSPACVPDVAREPDFLRAAEAAHDRLHAAFAFPIVLGGEVLGVIDVLSRDVREPDPDLLGVMATIGSQIGQFIERKRAERALKIAETELAHVARVSTLGELAASIAHEVNTPLAAIVADAEACLNWLAAGRVDVDRLREALEAIVAQSDRTADVIQRIRQLATKQVSRSAPVDVNDVIRDVVPLVRTTLRQHEVSLVLDLAPDVTAVEGDRVQLQQVVLNLVINAIDAMAGVTERPRELLIRSRPQPPGRVLVAVSDTGVGIDATTADGLFEAFFTTKSTGMGMGLSISRSIIEAHGGRLWATPDPDGGATFQFTLPVPDRGTVDA
jgi:PAS domain S-box-containing protein